MSTKKKIKRESAVRNAAVKKPKTSPKNKPVKTGGKTMAEWHLLLYVAGMTPKSSSALMNLKAICDEHLEGKYVIEVIDLLEKPQLAKGDQILAIPTLVRKLPSPIKKLIGDLSNSDRVLVGLNLKAIGF